MIDWISITDPIEYSVALSLMEEKLEQVILNAANETVFMLEHQDVYTAGTSYKKEELLQRDLKIPVFYTGRGGKFTYHGPGQLVIYPVIDLRRNERKKDLKLYIRNLEQSVIDSLMIFDIKAYTIDGKIGVWVNQGKTPAKIAAIGVRVKKWVTYHGIAVNISTNLSKYSGIIPCGIANFPVTSLKALGVNVSKKTFNSIFRQGFMNIF